MLPAALHSEQFEAALAGSIPGRQCRALGLWRRSSPGASGLAWLPAPRKRRPPSAREETLQLALTQDDTGRRSGFAAGVIGEKRQP